MLSSIYLKNFKGFKEFKMDLTPITLIGGKNNSGKSSVLEAIMFLFAHSTSDCFFKMNQFRQMNDQPLITPERLWEPLFNNFDATNELIVKLSDTISGDKVLTLTKNTEIASSTINSADTMRNNFNQTGRLPNNYPLKFNYRMPQLEEDGNYNILNQNGVAIEFTNKKEIGTHKLVMVEMFKTETPYNSQITSQWFGQLILQDKKEEVIKTLKIFDSTIVDIQTIAQGALAYLYVIFADGHKIPLAYMGDGIGRLLNIIMGIVANPESIILIDEVENGFHYSIYEKFWSMVGLAAKENGCQVIATTHSRGMIDGAVTGIREADMENSFSYIRLEKQEDDIKPHVFDTALLDYALASEMEVR